MFVQRAHSERRRQLGQAIELDQAARGLQSALTPDEVLAIALAAQDGGRQVSSDALAALVQACTDARIAHETWQAVLKGHLDVELVDGEASFGASPVPA